jgi:hypothetical protein
LGEVSAEEDFNTLGIVYKKKETKFIKNYEYFQTMRNKELGQVEVEQVEEEEEQEAEHAVQTEEQNVGFEANDEELFNSLLPESSLTAEEFEETWNQL